ncbi:hypothetical protein CYMTET_33793, partial [Cymbomonas tetramitiformis]
GAVFAYMANRVLVEDSSFINNHAIASHFGDYVLADNDGGAGLILYTSDKTEFLNTHFSGSSGGMGGHLYLESLPSLSIQNSKLELGTAWYGGALYVNTLTGDFDLQSSSFEGNAALGGGAVYLNIYEAELAIIDCTFTFNSALDAGSDAVSSYGGALIISNTNVYLALVLLRCSLVNNSATHNGGAVYMKQASYMYLVVHDSLLEGNSAGEGGGAVYLEHESTPASDHWALNISVCGIDGHGGPVAVNPTSKEQRRLPSVSFLVDFTGAASSLLCSFAVLLLRSVCGSLRAHAF